MELTILMPCLNEAETVGTCVTTARTYLDRSGIAGEVVVADNGSTDGSQQLAEAAGARVVSVPERGYGAAVRAGIDAARGRLVVMGDADGSYDFSALDPFVERLGAGTDLVMGNRFAGGIAPGAMPPLHRYVGNPLLSGIGRLLFGVPVGDFHCGLRGFARQRMIDLHLRSTGMELASEMVVRASLAGFAVAEVPTTLAPDGRSRPPHLRSWRDGWRHLRFLLLFSPRWLFEVPGVVLMALALAVGVPLCLRPISVGSVTFDVDTLVVAAAAFIIGFQAVQFALFTRVYAATEGFLPEDRRTRRAVEILTLERGLLIAGLLIAAGIAGVVTGLLVWHRAGFGALDPDQELRLIVPSVVALTTGCQVALGSLFLSILGIRHHSDPVRSNRVVSGGRHGSEAA